jgi:hypothetical protein
MIEKTLKTIGGKINIKIPSLLNELTLGQLMGMQEKIDLSDIKDPADLHVFGEAVLSLSMQIKYLYNSDETPKTVTFYHGERPVQIKVINNLSVEPAGAFFASRDIIATEINEHIKNHGEEDWQQRFNPSLKACCQVLAHYFYCRVTGERYNEYKIEAFCDAINVGFVDNWTSKTVHTVEGNTNQAGSREGDGVYRKIRLTRQIYAVTRFIK